MTGRRTPPAGRSCGPGQRTGRHARFLCFMPRWRPAGGGGVPHTHQKRCTNPRIASGFSVVHRPGANADSCAFQKNF